MARTKKPLESVRGSYSAMPHAVLDSLAYTGSSMAAKALLGELIRQHCGTNNGHLHLAHGWLAGRGWASKSIVEKARSELIERGLIVQTRQGGLVIGPTLYALSWLAVSNFAGLEITPRSYAPGAWRLCQLPPTSRRKPPIKKRERQPVHRGSADPTTGALRPETAPTTGAITPIQAGFTDPTTGDNVCVIDRHKGAGHDRHIGASRSSDFGHLGGGQEWVFFEAFSTRLFAVSGARFGAR